MTTEHNAAMFAPSTPAISTRGRVVRCLIEGRPVFFSINKKKDVIQAEHLQGRFYEPEELQIIARYVAPGAVFCDIGANIGNHSLYALLFLQVARVILFEPNPLAVDVLRSNMNMNGLADRCDMTHLGIGLSDVAAGGLTIVAPHKNLGGGRMVEGDGVLQVMRGDDLLGDTAVDFIKIDVEGMEMRVLAGLSGVVAKWRPTMFVEVDSANAEAFGAWVDANDYEVRETFRRYDVNENFLILPKSPRTEQSAR